MFAPQTPDEFTDDCSVQMRSGCTVQTLVDFVIEQLTAKVSPDLVVEELGRRFVIDDDAEFALDRVLGGIVRAATKNPANCPDIAKDPVAWASYQLAISKPEIIRAIRPEMYTDE